MLSVYHMRSAYRITFLFEARCVLYIIYFRCTPLNLSYICTALLQHIEDHTVLYTTE